MSKLFRLMCPVLALAFVAVLTGGCHSATAIRADYTNSLDSHAQHTEQDRNTYARTIDHNTRSAWDDLANIMLLDRPGRLTYYQVD